MSATLTVKSSDSKTVIPAEYRGKARLFRDAISAEDQAVGQMITLLDGTIRARVKRGNPVPRRDVLAGVVRDWERLVPPCGRLALEIDFAKRGKSLSVREMRLSSSEYLDATWNETERGLAVIMVGLDVGPLRYEFIKHTLCHVSMHALGRRMERGSDASADTIKCDLHMLGLAHYDLADRPNDAAVTVSLAHGGSWRGNVAAMRTPRGSYDKGLMIRTYLADDKL